MPQISGKPAFRQIYQRLTAEPKTDLPADVKKVYCQVRNISKVFELAIGNLLDDS